MNFNEMRNQVRTTGRKVARQSTVETLGYEELSALELTIEDIDATDWIIEPEPRLQVSMSDLVAAWNGSQPPGTSVENQAPNSARFKRFVQALTRGA